MTDESLAVLRATDPANQDAEHYIVVHRADFELVKDGDVLTHANVTAHPIVQGIQDYTRDDQDLSAAPIMQSAFGMFDARGQWLQVIHVRQGDVLEL